MPLGKGVRYRWHDPGKPGGPKVRLAFKNNKVIEAKSSSGKIHTEKEFKQDRLRSKAKKKAMRGK